MEEFVALIAILCFFAIPLSAIWGHHRRKMLELQLRLRQGDDASVRTSLEALREEVRTLRDTTMQYDISFDAALQRMDRRVGHIEREAIHNAPERIAELNSIR